MTTGQQGPRAAALYVRESQADDELAVERQESECRALGKAKGWSIVKVYADNDTPSKKRTHRKAYEAMVADAKARVIDAILVWDADRLSRVPRENEDIIDFAEEYGIELATVGGEIDLSTANGRLMFRIKGAVAKHESEHKSDRIKSKFNQLRESGDSTGGEAFGWDRKREPVKYAPVEWSLNEKEAKLIATATERILATPESFSLGAIITEWNKAGVLTRPKRAFHSKDSEPTQKLWSYSSLAAVLCRWRNAGVISVNDEPGREATWPAIAHDGYVVTVDKVRRIRELLANPERRTNNEGNARKHFLSGILVCGKCGNRMRSGAARTKAGIHLPLYVCKGSGGCRASVLMDVAEEKVIDAVSERLALPDAQLLASTANDRQSMASLRERRNELETEEHLIEESRISLQVQLRKLAKLQAERVDIDGQLAQLVQRDAVTSLLADLMPIESEQAIYWTMQQSREQVRTKFNALSLDRKQSVVRALCDITIAAATKGIRPTRESAKARVRITPRLEQEAA
jgi:DNA invertase Pin-like site-specific DNA recombinase